jgi:hypothetical protein
VAGKYVDAAGSSAESDCIECSMGKYSTAVGSVAVSTCIDCAAGRYVAAVGSDAPDDCIECPSGRYGNATALVASSECTACPSDSSSAGGSNELRHCLCSTGYYDMDGSSVDQNVACDACPAGSTTDTLGQPGAVSCTACVAGKYSSSSQVACASCPHSSNAVAGSTSVTDCLCDPGYTGTIASVSDVCAACASGRYKASSGVAACDSCPSGSSGTGGLEGSTSSSACQCDPGFEFVAHSSNCDECAPGRFKDTTSAADSAPSTDTCRDCNGGSVTDTLDQPGATSCTLCAEGQYTSSSEVRCANCPPNAITLQNGSTSVTDCVCNPIHGLD